MDRKGEKFGWTAGWIGGFLWVLVFAIMWLFKGETFHGATATILFLLALLSIIKLMPWKHPYTKFWKLMIPTYSIFLISAIFVVYVLNGFDDLARIQYGLWMFPCLSPIIILGNRTWNSEKC